jgi:hypothetical protein
MELWNNLFARLGHLPTERTGRLLLLGYRWMNDPPVCFATPGEQRGSVMSKRFFGFGLRPRRWHEVHHEPTLGKLLYHSQTVIMAPAWSWLEIRAR